MLQPAFREQDRRASLALYIAKSAPAAAEEGDKPEEAELSVAAHSKPATLAGKPERSQLPAQRHASLGKMVPMLESLACIIESYVGMHILHYKQLVLH